MEAIVLEGSHVRLEPLGTHHIEPLLAAAQADPGLYNMTVVPQSGEEMAAYVETALAAQRSGVAVPFATVRAATGEVIGSTRFFDVDRWAWWPRGHPRAGREMPDVCEIGYTWLTRS